MRNIPLLSMLTIISIFFTNCNKRECLSQNDYNGLYNALTCDYESRLISISSHTFTKKLNNIELFTAYQNLIAKVTNKEEELALYKKNIQHTENLINKIEVELDNMDTQQKTKNLLKKIRHQVISMKQSINTRQPKFTTSEIQYTKRKIKSKKIATNKETILAKKFIHKNNQNINSLNQAYSKSYEENKKVQEALQAKLNESIRIILMSEKANHLNKENKEKLMSALKETKRYTSKVK